MNTYAQDIRVGEIEVDTGNDWLDLAFVTFLIILVAVLAHKLRRP